MQKVMTSELLLSERIQLEQSNIITGCIGSVSCAVVFYFIIADSLQTLTYLNIWLSSQFVLLLFWLVFVLFFKKGFFQNKEIWHLISSFTSLLYGLLWSVSWFLFVDTNDTELFTFWLYILVMILAGGIYATVFHLPSAILFIVFLYLPILIDVSIYPMSYKDWLLYLFIMTPVFGIVFSVLLNRFILAAIEQREKNYLLVQQLEEEKKQVEKVSQEKTRFLAAASHDLRQPIQSIRLFEYILSSRLTEPEDKALLEKLNNSTDSLASLLDSLLDLSKLDAGVMTVDKKIFCIDDVLSRVYQQYMPIAADQDIILRYVPSYAMFESDPQQLERIIRNLVVNAIKHMGKGSILLGVRRSGSRIVIVDNGIGIPAKEKENIFQEFYQLNNPERNRSKGLGLGLAIVQRTAILLGHTISLESEMNKGCTFMIHLPIIQQDQKTVNISSEMDRHTIPSENSRTILVIEDDQEVLQALDALLRNWGHRTILASNKVDAIYLGKKHKIDAVVSDYQLQNDDNGMAIILLLREYYKDILPAILITGNTSPEVLRELSQYKVPILNKPFLPNQFAERLNEVL